MDAVRRLVSGKKARFVQDGFDLDLVRLTDRMIIMGYPADGLAALYRNKRSDVLRFLEPFAPHFRIFNLCPIYENSYDPSVFLYKDVEREGAPVVRFPWPDHHPPPLSLMPVMADGAKRWYEADERNVVVIHCKAGKGRSGSFAISLLLSLPGLPSAPAIESDPSTGSDEKDEKNALDPRVVLGKTTEEIAHMTMQDKLEYLLRFHTVRRMSPGAKTYGVSIASQRRWLGYFCRLLEKDDPRLPLSLNQPPPPVRRILLEYVTITGPGLQGAGKVLSGGKDKMAVQVYRYKDSIAANLRRRELALASGTSSNVEDWDDKSEMFVSVGGLVESSSSRPASPALPQGKTVTSAPVAASSSSSSSHFATTPEPSTTADDTASTASASTGSLPSAVLATPLSSASSSTPSLPPPSATSAYATSSAPLDTLRPSRSRRLVPQTSFLPVAEDPLRVEGGNPQRRSAQEAKEKAKEEGGIVLDGDRDLQLRFLVGETGKKHGMLPTMAALALCWFIPAFESPPAGDGRAKLVVKAKELDFLKPFAGIEEIEVGWRWLS
ncbi:hypothetical protein JCM6882_002614 [Rhodosporidiobolus microsporus]